MNFQTMTPQTDLSYFVGFSEYIQGAYGNMIYFRTVLAYGCATKMEHDYVQTVIMRGRKWTR